MLKVQLSIQLPHSLEALRCRVNAAHMPDKAIFWPWFEPFFSGRSAYSFSSLPPWQERRQGSGDQQPRQVAIKPRGSGEVIQNGVCGGKMQRALAGIPTSSGQPSHQVAINNPAE